MRFLIVKYLYGWSCAEVEYFVADSLMADRGEDALDDGAEEREALAICKQLD